MTTTLMAVAVFTLLLVLLSVVVLVAKHWLQPHYSVSVTINGATQLSLAAGQKLLGELNNAGIPVPSACAGAGTCGLCKVQVISGGGAPLPTEVARLSKSEREDGIRLACQLTIREDLVLAVPDNILSAKSFKCRLIRSRNLSPLIKEMTFEVPDNTDFGFTPGMYVQVTAPSSTSTLRDVQISKEHLNSWQNLNVSDLEISTEEDTIRAYSIASTPADSGKIVLLIRLALPPPGQRTDWPPGKVSSWLFNRVKGDTVEITGPFGDFLLLENDREIVLIGGGVGMAPLRAMIHKELASTSPRRLHFYYGARCLEDFFYQEEFDALAKQHAQFTWTVALSEPSSTDNWMGDVGFIHDVVNAKHIKLHENPNNCDYYLCGPPLMLKAVVAMLGKAEVNADQIYADDFGS